MSFEFDIDLCFGKVVNLRQFCARDADQVIMLPQTWLNNVWGEHQSYDRNYL